MFNDVFVISAAHCLDAWYTSLSLIMEICCFLHFALHQGQEYLEGLPELEISEKCAHACNIQQETSLGGCLTDLMYGLVRNLPSQTLFGELHDYLTLIQSM